jgi:hypothetical protein
MKGLLRLDQMSWDAGATQGMVEVVRVRYSTDQYVWSMGVPFSTLLRMRFKPKGISSSGVTRSTESYG